MRAEANTRGTPFPGAVDAPTKKRFRTCAAGDASENNKRRDEPGPPPASHPPPPRPTVRWRLAPCPPRLWAHLGVAVRRAKADELREAVGEAERRAAAHKVQSGRGLRGQAPPHRARLSARGGWRLAAGGWWLAAGGWRARRGRDLHRKRPYFVRHSVGESTVSRSQSIRSRICASRAAAPAGQVAGAAILEFSSPTRGLEQGRERTCIPCRSKRASTASRASATTLSYSPGLARSSGMHPQGTSTITDCPPGGAAELSVTDGIACAGAPLVTRTDPPCLRRAWPLRNRGGPPAGPRRATCYLVCLGRWAPGVCEVPQYTLCPSLLRGWGGTRRVRLVREEGRDVSG